MDPSPAGRPSLQCHREQIAGWALFLSPTPHELFLTVLLASRKQGKGPQNAESMFYSGAGGQL